VAGGESVGEEGGRAGVVYVGLIEGWEMEEEASVDGTLIGIGIMGTVGEEESVASGVSVGRRVSLRREINFLMSSMVARSSGFGANILSSMLISKFVRL